MAKLTVDSTGQLKLPLAIRHQLGTGALQALSHSANHLLLGRSDTESPVVFSGCLGEMAVPDLLSFPRIHRDDSCGAPEVSLVICDLLTRIWDYSFGQHPAQCPS